MINISYNLSSVLKENLQKSDTLRKNILTTPLSRKFEIQLRWNSAINKIFYSLNLSGNPLKKSEVIKLIESSSERDSKAIKKLNVEQRLVLNYKKALDHISQNWHVSKKNVSLKDILILYDVFGEGNLRVPRSDLEAILDYVQIQEEHPIIKAGIANIQIQELQPFSEENEILSRLVSYLFLFKYGYDVDGLIEFEKEWVENKKDYEEAVSIGIAASSKTIWLEFFSKSIVAHLESVYEKIKTESSDFLDKEASLWKLNDRQRDILNLLEKPDSSITNKTVQKYFKISQITASRDLAKLTTLGLLFSHGKGRSVYYIRA